MSFIVTRISSSLTFVLRQFSWQYRLYVKPRLYNSTAGLAIFYPAHFSFRKPLDFLLHIQLFKWLNLWSISLPGTAENKTTTPEFFLPLPAMCLRSESSNDKFNDPNCVSPLNLLFSLTLESVPPEVYCLLFHCLNLPSPAKDIKKVFYSPA